MSISAWARLVILKSRRVVRVVRVTVPPGRGRLLLLLIAMFWVMRGSNSNNEPDVITGVSLLVILGGGLELVYTRFARIGDYFGGRSVLIMLGTALIVWQGIIPVPAVESIRLVLEKSHAIDVFISTLIVGSIWQIDREFIRRASFRLFPVIIASIGGGIGVLSLAAFILNAPWKNAMVEIGLPVLSDGLAGGSIPLASIFDGAFGKSKTELLNAMLPGQGIANIISILAAVQVRRLGILYPAISGKGAFSVHEAEWGSCLFEAKEAKWSKIMIGALIVAVMWGAALVVSRATGIHAFAILALTTFLMRFFIRNLDTLGYPVLLLKDFLLKTLTPFVLSGVGAIYLSLSSFASVVTLKYLVLVVSVIAGAILGAAIAGPPLGFYLIESIAVVSLCLTNLGGTGDLAVLTAADRIRLIGFAQIASRIGGALILLVASIWSHVF